MSNYAASALVTVALVCSGCVSSGKVIAAAAEPEPPASALAQVWLDPGPAPRDLFWGIGGERQAPPSAATYVFVRRDDTGFSASYDVTGPDGTEWSAKIGPEAQTEVVVSRILWGLGYHQPPVYYLPSWTLDTGSSRKESEARFRPKLPQLQRADEYWKWADNPFIGARPFRGMLVALLMLNATDLKDDNNSIYDVQDGWDGANRWFVVRDLGAALGETGKLYPRRNWLEGFERSGFITAVKGRRVEFDYHGRHQQMLAMIDPDDVRWTAERMNRLTPAQWRDAFRAANYPEPIAERFIRKIQSKVADGLALGGNPAPAEASR